MNVSLCNALGGPVFQELSGHDPPMRGTARRPTLSRSRPHRHDLVHLLSWPSTPLPTSSMASPRHSRGKSQPLAFLLFGHKAPRSRVFLSKSNGMVPTARGDYFTSLETLNSCNLRRKRQLRLPPPSRRAEYRDLVPHRASSRLREHPAIFEISSITLTLLSGLGCMEACCTPQDACAALWTRACTKNKKSH